MRKQSITEFYSDHATATALLLVWLSAPLLIFALFVLAPRTCLAASVSPAASDTAFTFRHWRSQDGLPENTVQTLSQTPDGYLWIGTTGGLARFGGDYFDCFDISNAPSLRESNVRSLLTSQDGSLWIGTDGGGLLRYHDRSFQRITVPQSLSTAFVRTIYEDRHQHIWAGTDRGLYRQINDRSADFEAVHPFAKFPVQTIFEEQDGTLWFGGDYLYSYDGHSFREQKLIGSSVATAIRSLFQSSDGSLWVGTASSLYRRRPGTMNFAHIATIGSSVTSIIETADHTVWFGSSGNGIYYLKDTHLFHLETDRTIQVNSVLALLSDSNGNLWVGTPTGLLQLLRPSVQVFHIPGRTDAESGTVCLDKDGTLWAAYKTLYIIRNGHATSVNFPFLEHVNVRNVLRDRRGALWFGTNGSGLYRYNRGSIDHFTVKRGLVSNFIRVMAQSADGAIWIGTEDGVSRYLSGQFKNFDVSHGLVYPTIHAIVQSQNGDIWIGTSRGISHLHNLVFESDEVTKRLESSSIWTICTDTNSDTIWFGTRGDGLFGYNNHTLLHFTADDGIDSNSIYKIVANRYGDLWLSGPKGISSISERELFSYAQDLSLPLFPRLYYASDGADPVQFYGGIQPGGWVSSSGDVWFPSDRGPVRLKSTYPPNPTSRLVITRASVDGQNTKFEAGIALAANSDNIEISFSSVLLVPQDGISYRFRIEGLDSGWSLLSHQRTARFSMIPAGQYLFHVQAFDRDHPEHPADAYLKIVKAPHFYRTIWFKIGVVSIAFLAIVGIYRMKQIQTHARFETVLKERARLAREMHETVLQGCASVSSLLEASYSVEKDPPMRKQLVQLARNQISLTIEEARRAVWNLRNPQNNSIDVEPAIRKLVARVGEEHRVDIVCNIHAPLPQLEEGRLHEVIMAAREALNNALTHANAAIIGISAECTAGNRLLIHVWDNGRGFDLSRVNSDTHYGLIGMRERVEVIGGFFTLKSEQNRGTDVLFEIPLRRRQETG